MATGLMKGSRRPTRIIVAMWSEDGHVAFLVRFSPFIIRLLEFVYHGTILSIPEIDAQLSNAAVQSVIMRTII
jgi:hypothetical protein